MTIQVPTDVEERGVVSNEVLGAVLRTLPEDCSCMLVLDGCHAGTMVDLPFVCDRARAPKKALTLPPPAVRMHLLAATRDVSSDAAAYGAAGQVGWAGALTASLLSSASLRSPPRGVEATWGQLLEDSRAHLRRSKARVVPLLSSSAPIDLAEDMPLL